MQWLINMAIDAMEDTLDAYTCFTPRTISGSPAIELGDLTADGFAHEISLAAFLPANAKVALLNITVQSYSSGQVVTLDRSTNYNAYTSLTLYGLALNARDTNQMLLDVTVAKTLRYTITGLGLAVVAIEVLGSFK